MTYSDADVREAIRSVVATAAPLAVVFKWWVLGHKRETWPGLLRSSSDADRVHGYIITRSKDEGEPKAMNCVRRLWTYDIAAFHYYATGTQSANTDLTFNAEVNALCDAFDDVTGLDASIRRIRTPLTFRVDLDVFGSELLHIGQGQIVIEAC